MVRIMKKEKEQVQKTINLLAEIIYELYGEMKKGNIDIKSVSKQAVGKSAIKAKTFHQTAFDYGE